MVQKVQEMRKKPNIFVIWGDDIGIENSVVTATE